MKNPADAGRRQGSGLVVCFPARDLDRDNLNPVPSQQNIAVLRLSRRYGLLPSTASAIAAANCWGPA